MVYRRGDTASPKGLVVCAACERHAPRCAGCRVPINADVDGDGLCATCRASTPVCAACGQRVRGQYYRNRAGDAVFCETCFRGQPRCDICGGVAVPGGQRLHDGRTICAGCHETAIYDPAPAQAVYERVLTLMSSELGLQLSIPPALNLVDRPQMLALLPQAGTDDARRSDVERPDLVFGLFVRRGRKRTVYVESGLPQILMIQVISHELAHAWQGENCPLLRDPLFREGFAEWVAYKVLLNLGAVKKAALMLQRTDLYGQGLQTALSLERQGGAGAVFGACRAT